VKILLTILLCILPLKIVFNDEITVLTWKANTYIDLLIAYEKTQLKRGESKRGRLKRIDKMKRNIFIINYKILSHD